MRSHRVNSVRVIVAVFGTGVASVALGQPVLYVDGSASGLNDGSSWCDAYTSLQDALVDAAISDEPVGEIRVARGAYRPDVGGDQTMGDRHASFRLINDVALLGGYAGCGSIDPDARNIERHETILSGDLQQNDTGHIERFGENSFHVVVTSGTSRTAILDGFTISGGNANGADPDLRGGGLLNEGGSPTIRRCRFYKNRAMLGGAFNSEGGSPLIEHSTFSENVAEFSGAAIRTWQTQLEVVNALFTENTAEAGGAIWFGASSPVLSHCTFTGNVATDGNALAFDSCCPEQPSDFVARDCILWDGVDTIANVDGSSLEIEYSDLPGSWPGIGNINSDPQFTPGPRGCYYLGQSGAGQSTTSPCVDAGSALAGDLDVGLLTTRSDEAIDTGGVDIGFHFPVSGEMLRPGDYDRSGRTDLRDFARLAACFTGAVVGETAPCCRIFDVDFDTDIDLDDAASFTDFLTDP